MVMRVIVRNLLRVVGAMVLVGASGLMQAQAAELRLLSYNIHHGEGLDGRLDLDRIAAFIREQRADVVALQEVDQGCVRTGGTNQADELARLTGQRAFFVKFMDYQGGEYGMAMLTRLPVLKQQRIELPAGREPRAAAVVTVQTAGGPVTLADIHFYATETQRLAQAQALWKALAGTAHPVIWIGDFNSQRGDAVMNWLEPQFAIPAKQGPTNTFPANLPRREIDYVLFHPKEAFTIKECRVLDEPVLSDHRPVLAVLEFAPASGTDPAETVRFDDAATGQAPPGWTTKITGEGEPRWTVERETTAPSNPHVLLQSAEVSRPGFPLALRQNSSVRDGFVEVKFKTVSGKIDQAGGVVWRARDESNYYVCRANAVEDNVVLYKVERGKRTALDIVGRAGGYGVEVKVAPAQWHTLRVEFAGARFTVKLNGRTLFEVEDGTFAGAGQMGLWTKADSVTQFDDFAWGGTREAPSDSVTH